jgi:regulator of chromosome condensation
MGMGNNFGQTGIEVGAGKGGNTIIIPQKVKSLTGHKMKMIQDGRHHSIGITQSGECLVWGRMDGAQMGLNISALPVDDPKKVISERGRPQILLQPTALPILGCICAAAGSDHNILVTSEGRAYSWGFNATYQCGQGPSTDDIPVETLIDNHSVRDKNLCWAGAGGQYSILASPHGYAKSDGKPLTNGLHAA